MATVKLDKFGGIMPRLHPSFLPDGSATVAHNCRLKSGKLVPLHQPSVLDESRSTLYFENGLSSISKANSVYCWKHTMKSGEVRTDFLAFPGRVYFAHGNIADDQYDRVFVTGETGVRFVSSIGEVVNDSPCVYLFDRASGSVIRHTMLKDVLDRPRVSLADGGPTGENITSAYFFVTWFDRFGYESEISEPSFANNGASGDPYADVPLEYEGASARVRFQPVVVPAGAYGVRIYKSNSGDESQSIQFVKEFSQAELPSLATGFTVKVDDEMLGETMPDITNPPHDLVDMSFVPGSFYAARSLSMPHTILFSDVDLPTSWPLAYRYDIRDNIVKLAVTSNTVFALTDGFPYVLSGTAPESMVASSIAGPAACVSEKAVCVWRNAVFFVSNYGLYCIQNDANAGTVCQCLTDRYFTKEQWQELNPPSAIMGQFDNALHLFFEKKDGTHEALIIDLADGSAVITTHDEVATCLCTDDRTDELYFVRKTIGAEVVS